VALDADAQSAAEVQQCYSSYGVETVTSSFRRLLSKKSGTGEFDLVYSTGLFDYLNQRTGRRLTEAMFQMLRPGGRLLIANFLPGILDVGYMESYMAWKLIYRTRQEMLAISEEVPLADIRDIRLFVEENQNIIFLQMTKR